MSLNLARIYFTATPDDSTMGPPSFAKKLKKQMAITDGAKLELTVNVKGDPEPQVTWSKNDQIVTSSDVVDLRYKNGVATLTINEIFPEDAGTYTCTATNSIGTVSTTTQLTVDRKFHYPSQSDDSDLILHL